MKRSIGVTLILLIMLLIQACSGPSEEEIRLKIQAEANQTATQNAVLVAQTAVVETQMAIDSEKAALSMTQTAITSPQTTSASALCPEYVYQDWGADANHFVPEGWMGDTSDITFDENFKLDTSRQNVIKIVYSPHGSQGFAGIYWWVPGTNWGNGDDVGFDISCASKITFWARGEKGGEKAEFKVGGLKGTHSDSLQPAESSGPITLTKEWVQYSIDLTGKDLRHILGGFVWVTNKPSNPNGATIYIDDIRFE